MKFAAHCRVHELQHHVFADTFKIAITPVFERIGGSFSPAFLRRTLITASRWVRLNFIGRTPHDVDSSAVSFPTGYTRGEVLVRVCDSTIVLLFECVVGRIGVGITALPKLLDELLAFLVGSKVKKRTAFFRGYDVNDVLVKPFPILGVQFLPKFFVALGFLLRRLFSGILVGLSLLLFLRFALSKGHWRHA